MKYLILITLSAFAHLAIAQSSIQFIDTETRQPVGSVAIEVNTPTVDSALFIVTNKLGKVNIPFAPPYHIKASHIGYSPIDTNISDRNTEIQLTPLAQYLDDVVITGQHLETSIDNSIYQVKLIDKERIASQAAVSLKEVLQTQLNVQFSRDNALGTSGISIQGLAGQNVKILLNGVPISGRSGVANEIDLNQIDLSNVERIEVIEGPMAVNYGADAIAGVINIITIKKQKHRYEATINLHEETVAKDYSLFDEGIHNPSINLGAQLSDKLYARLNSNFRKYGGWTGDLPYNERNKMWYPKEQWNNGALIQFQNNNLKLFYQATSLHETITNLGEEVITQLYDPQATDEEYKTERWTHQIQGDYALGKNAIHTVISFSDYERHTHQYRTNLATNEKTDTNPDEQDTISFKDIYTQAYYTYNKHKNWSTQVGAEATFENAEGTTLNDGEKEIHNLAVFTSTEVSINEKLGLRAGIRFNYNSQYKTAPTPSVNIKYTPIQRLHIRAGYGRGYRAPSLRELYHEFIDSNHNILGNSELDPEHSHHFDLNVESDLGQKGISLGVNGFYNVIYDQIGYITPSDNNPDMVTTYSNISKYKTLGSNLTFSWQHHSLNMSSGLGYIGRYQELSEDYSVDHFLYNFQANTNLSYKLKPIDLTLSAYYKYNGKYKSYFATITDEGNTDPKIESRDGYHLLDITISKPLFKYATLTLGSKNITNTTSAKNNFSSSDAHSDNTGQTSIGYGRSYFLTVKLHLHSNK